MKITDILIHETPGNTDIYLHREGLFWKAYEYSAFLFIQTVRVYNPQKKWMKGLGREVVSLGFPDSVLQEILQGRTTEQTGDKRWVIKGTEPVSEEAFEEWKANLKQHIPSVATVATVTANVPTGVVTQIHQTAQQEVLRKLAAFQVESASPLQCMMFISELQKELRS